MSLKQMFSFKEIHSPPSGSIARSHTSKRPFPIITLGHSCNTPSPRAFPPPTFLPFGITPSLGAESGNSDFRRRTGNSVISKVSCSREPSPKPRTPDRTISISGQKPFGHDTFNCQDQVASRPQPSPISNFRRSPSLQNGTLRCSPCVRWKQNSNKVLSAHTPQQICTNVSSRWMEMRHPR